ncbi:restriction endonuclease [Coraliomargarita sp. SDUM461003]|uniref:Restriction endonuclease n=1 Tax=Thalassobacterium maritimum TaxID=3041265 RepID=A0ABU1APW3_9BACT|nr:restriction endonuclease [Coraliomargarita sp. SDUM461003]MDQ8206185.1 restriction endonuclease [Coraliomargarita sp. SDUM461003]
MAQENKTLWGIHGGKTGDADSIFLKSKCIALGWDKMPDLSTLGGDREVFKAKIQEAYPDKKPGAIPNNAGQLYRFIHEVKIGDLVIYPSKMDRQIHIGEVEGEYYYSNKSGGSYPHRLKVKWLKAFPRTRFAQGALYEIGSALSFFQVKNYADEFLGALSGEQLTKRVEEDETVSLVAEDIETTAEDFILKTLAQELKGHPFEEFVAHLLGTMGYWTRGVPKGADGGVDIVATKDELGVEPPIIKVQVKSTEGSVGNPEVTALYGNVDQNEFGLLFTLGSFTSQAKVFARNKTNLRLIDGPELVKMVLNHYEDFNSKYKGLIPLKRVYVPEPQPEND